MKRICCIGHLTLDKIVTPQATTYMPGGTSFYFAHGWRHLGDSDCFQLVTCVGRDNMAAIEEMRAEGLKVKVLKSRNTVFFENKYKENQNERTQRVLSKADPFTVEGLKDVEADIFHLGSLLADDFSPKVVEYLSRKGAVSLDVQGYLREVRGEQVFAVDWPEKREVLRYVDIVKVNEYEMDVLTGTADPHEAARRLSGWGVKEVVVTLGDYGSIILADGRFYEIPSYRPVEVVDATGCGDTYMTGYLYQRAKGASVAEAGRFAAAMSTIKLQASGPFSQSEEEIRRVIAESGKQVVEREA